MMVLCHDNPGAMFPTRHPSPTSVNFGGYNYPNSQQNQYSSQEYGQFGQYSSDSPMQQMSPPTWTTAGMYNQNHSRSAHAALEDWTANYGVPPPPSTVSPTSYSYRQTIGMGLDYSQNGTAHSPHPMGVIVNSHHDTDGQLASPDSGSSSNNGASNAGPASRQHRPPYDWMKRQTYQSIPAAGKTRTKEKYRVVYSDHQRLELEKEFHYSKYITIRRKSELAQNLSLSERQVKIWFQNRRAKERKQNKKKPELSPGAMKYDPSASPENDHISPMHVQ